MSFGSEFRLPLQRGRRAGAASIKTAKGAFAAVMLAAMSAMVSGAPHIGSKLQASSRCQPRSRATVEQIQDMGTARVLSGKSSVLAPSAAATCFRGFSNQIDCFARIVLLADAMGAVLVLENFRFWSAPYQHRDGKLLEPLRRPDPFPNNAALPPTVELGLLWDEDYLISELFCRTKLVVLKRLPPGFKLPKPSCLHVRELGAKKGRRGAQTVSLDCWQKANFIGVHALELKKAVVSSLRPSPFIRHFSEPIIAGLLQLGPSYTAVHLRLEADAVAGGISRKIDPQEVFRLLLQHNLPNTTVLYIAAGGFKGKQELMEEWGKRFILRTKEAFVPNINEILPEREFRAAVEFDVLRSSHILFGHGCSSMTTIATQIRCFSEFSKSSAAYYFDEHNTKGSQPHCGESIWNGKMAVRLTEKAQRPFVSIGSLKGSGLKRVPCLPRSKI